MSNLNKPNLDILFKDLDHPNPNINYQASLDMHRFWPDESKVRLIKNLDNNNIELRRKSVKALSYFGTDIIIDIVQIYLSNFNNTIRLSCLKILVLIASKYNLADFKDEINEVIEAALLDESVEISLAVVGLLRQKGKESLDHLQRLCRDQNVLKAKAAIIALVEFPDSSMQEFFKDLSNDSSVDILIRESASEAIKSNIR